MNGAPCPQARLVGRLLQKECLHYMRVLLHKTFVVAGAAVLSPRNAPGLDGVLGEMGRPGAEGCMYCCPP